MKILLVAAEVAPYSTVGGLSQVTHFLAKSLKRQGHDVRLFTARYGATQKKPHYKEVIHDMAVPTSYSGRKFPRELLCNVHLDSKVPLKTYLLENREYFTLRKNVYGYNDDHIRFALLSRGCLEWMKEEKKNKGWVPEMVHVHDWHTSYLCEDMRNNPRYQKTFKKIALLLTVHNFQMQGSIDFKYLAESERDKGKKKVFHFFHNDFVKQNPLLRGILYADWFNTVSENHVNEVFTPEYGEGLHKVLLKQKHKFSGILNGIDVDSFNPNKDRLIKQNFTKKSLNLRAENKTDLQKTFGLPVNPEIPLFGFVGRLSQQKGINLMLKSLPHVLEQQEAQFVFLGSGESKYRKALMNLSHNYPKKIKVHLYPDFKLPRKIFSGSDAILMPSIFEPGGIVALEALRYGAVPIVRATGGLADIVKNFSPRDKIGNGISFNQATEWALFASIIRVIELYQFTGIWKTLVKNAMKSDFSWNSVAKKYAVLYESVSQKRRKFLKENPGSFFEF